ncbi:unnamed protein product [Rotaria socialis]|uniref:Phosphoglycerate mutase n=1 Tax=Rotaria socialis TaxID=392032 RepID=A0A818C058_9BILA|nr:unnamed protein product [Rotaria socialis]CAF3810640.1 unnamed protein product [Rotaria socialis]CAF4523536.1 unnamed protein product [Rotaria socialis]CAF4563514.1 unnamed protein product [Rotaria socialis]
MATVRKKRIYFARHGERIDWIDKNWMATGERPSDPSLSHYGLQQARELALYVAQIQPRITHIYASPFLRTIQTALQVAHELNRHVSSADEIIKIRLEPGYGEYFFDEWDQSTIYRPSSQLFEASQNSACIDQDYDSVIKSDYYLQTKIESRQQLRNRLKRVIESTLDSSKDDSNILIVTHAAPLIEGARALATITRERNQGMNNMEEIENQKNLETNNLSKWEMLPIRAGVCSLTYFELINDKWILLENGLASYLSKGEQNVWIFPDDSSLYEPSE